VSVEAQPHQSFPGLLHRGRPAVAPAARQRLYVYASRAAGLLEQVCQFRNRGPPGFRRHFLCRAQVQTSERLLEADAGNVRSVKERQIWRVVLGHRKRVENQG
jgi:hypothetical protein